MLIISFISFHSILFHFIPFHSILFHSISFHSFLSISFVDYMIRSLIFSIAILSNFQHNVWSKHIFLVLLFFIIFIISFIRLLVLFFYSILLKEFISLFSHWFIDSSLCAFELFIQPEFCWWKVWNFQNGKLKVVILTVLKYI